MSTTIKVMSIIAQVAGFVSAMGAIPFVPANIGIDIALVATTIHNIVVNIEDSIDPGVKHS